MTESDILKITFMEASQSQKHVTFNEAVVEIDHLMQLSVIEMFLDTPPGSPVGGDRYIVGGTPTGAWAGKDYQIAGYIDGMWRFYEPKIGFQAYNQDDGIIYNLDNTFTWVPATGGINDMFSMLSTSEVTINDAITLDGTAFGKMHVCVDKGSPADYTVTLPAVTGNAGKFIGFRMSAALTKFITLDSGTDGIDVDHTRTMWKKETAVLYCDGTTWTKIFGKSIPFYAVVSDIFDVFGLNGMSLTASAFTKATFDIVDSDVAGLFDGSNNWFVIPRAGRYRFITNFRLEDDFAVRGFGIGAHTSATDGQWFVWFESFNGLGGGIDRNGAQTQRVADAAKGDHWIMYYYLTGTDGIKTAQGGFTLEEVITW